jgi:hypothetical protein
MGDPFYRTAPVNGGSKFCRAERTLGQQSEDPRMEAATVDSFTPVVVTTYIYCK